MKKKIAVIGGSGRSGIYLIRALLQQGFPIRVLLRNPENFNISDPLIEIIRGDVRHIDSLRTLFKGCEAVISTLSQPKGEEIPVFSQAARDIIRVMSENHIRRYLVIAGLNVDTPSDQKSPETRFATDWMKTNFPRTTADRQKEYEVLTESNIDWTMVRLPMIKQDEVSYGIKVSLEDCPGNKISTSDLAGFVIDQLEDDAYVRQAPFIASL